MPRTLGRNEKAVSTQNQRRGCGQFTIVKRRFGAALGSWRIEYGQIGICGLAVEDYDRQGLLGLAVPEALFDAASSKQHAAKPARTTFAPRAGGTKA
jgi:hypothetical protein